MLKINIYILASTMKNIHLLLCIILLIPACGGSNSGSNEKVNTDSCPKDAIEFSSEIFQTPGLHMYVFGDTGTGNDNQVLAANILKSYHLNYPVDAIIHTGDVFYPNGISSADDVGVFDKFDSIYSGEELEDIPWYLTAGNHDYDGNINALVAFANERGHIHYPSLYYQANLSKPSLEWSINLIATDTTPFISGTPQLAQLAWLEQSLFDNQGKFSLVVGHHPVKSYGKHGGNKILQGTMLDLLNHYRVPTYLAGHEHSLQLIEDERSYIISGAGGANLTSVECKANSLYAKQALGGFALYITPDTMWTIPVLASQPEIMFRKSIKIDSQ